MKTKITLITIIIVTLLLNLVTFKLWKAEKLEKERLAVNQTALATKVGSLLKTYKYAEFAWYHNQAIQTAKQHNIKPKTINHYYSIVDSFIHTDTILVKEMIEQPNEVRTVKIDNPCYNLDLLLLTDTIIATVEPIYNFSLFNYFEYERKTRVGRLIHLNWDKTYTAKCINNCTNSEIKIEENIEIQR
jgi:hypothetical protein